MCAIAPFAIELFNGHKFDIREKVTPLWESIAFVRPFIKHLTKRFSHFPPVRKKTYLNLIFIENITNLSI